MSNMPATFKVVKESKPVKAAHPRSAHPNTPPDSPIIQLPNPPEFARQVIDTVKLIQTSESKEPSPSAGLQVDSVVKQLEPIIQASKLEVKEVHEM